MRSPPCCLFCNDKQDIQIYQSGGTIFKKQIIIMDKHTDLSFICRKCNSLQPIETNIPLFWVNCTRCMFNHVSKDPTKCPLCEGAK